MHNNEASKDWLIKVNTWRASKPTVAQASGSSSSSKGAGERLWRAGKRMKLPAKLSLELARQCMPPNSQLFHSVGEGRIRGFYYIAGKRPSTGAAIEYWGLHAAMHWVLRFLWAKHLEYHPEVEVPFLDLMEGDIVPKGSKNA